MQKRICHRLVLMLAVTAVCGTDGIAWCQEGSATGTAGNTGYNAAPDLARTPPTTPAVENQFVSDDVNADNATLAGRVADLEKALKKMEDAAKADKAAADGKMTCTPCGRIQLDTASFSQVGNYAGWNQAVRPESNGVEFRRLYLCLQGGGFNVIQYKAEFDISGTNTNNAATPTDSYTSSVSTVQAASVQAKDVFLQINELPMIGHLRIGNFYEPFGMEATTSDLYTTFMERANTDMISPDRHIGVMAFDHFNENQDTLWELGGFCSAGGDGGMIFQDSHNYDASTLAGRVTWLPWYDECTNGRGLFHVGLAGNYQKAWANEYPLAKGPDTRPEESHLGLPYNFTMTNVDYVTQLGGELAWVYGPFSVQSEYAGAYATKLNGTSSPINAFYIQTSYFLTGENRVYDRNMACWTRVKPFENFFRVRDEDGCVCTGKGAWEVAYRWDNIDFTDALSTAGIASANGVSSSAMASRFSNHTIGLSWYLNPFTKLMFNYVYSTEIDTQTGSLGSQGGVHTSPNYLSVYEMRAQIDF